MGTLTGCLKKVTTLAAEDRAAIQQAARLHRKAGLSPKDAAIKAVDDLIAQVEAEAAPAAGDEPRASRAVRDQTQTPEFQRWFGDSKVVDADGKPLVVYHGTNADFSTFDQSKAGQTDSGWYGRGGFHFTPNPNWTFAEDAAESRGGNAVVMPVFVSLKNPAYGLANAERGSDLIGAAKGRGKDGVIIRFDHDHERAGEIAEVIAFRPEQIKSAIGNRGTFDPANADIRASRAAPFVAVERDDEGRPSFASAEAGIRIGFPQPTERLEVIEQPGEQVLNYAVMPMEGFDVLGFVELLVKDGQPVALLDIEMNDRGQGAGRKVIETLLAAQPGADLAISNIVPAARGFWAKMGVPEQNVEGAYDGTINWRSYQEAQDGRGADGAAQASRAAGEERDAGRESEAGPARADRESPQGLSRREAEAILGALPQDLIDRLLGRRPSVEQLREAIGKVPHDIDVAVVQSVDDLPPEQRKKLSALEPGGRVRGVYFPDIDRTWLIADHLHSEAEAVFVMLHEAFHRGLAKTFGADAKRVLRQMYHTNGRLQQLTKQQMQAHSIGQDEAIEEALADLAGQGKARDLKGWQRLVDIIRGWLSAVGRALGLDITWSDEMIEDFVAGAARAGLHSEPHANLAAEPAAARADQTQTPEFKRWFGDSKVVDAEGRPLVVYHGTRSDVTVFKDSRGRSLSALEKLANRLGLTAKGDFFFTVSPEFASQPGYGGTQGGNVMPVYLAIRNPLTFRQSESRSLADAMKQARADGHDGVRIVDWREGGSPVADVFIAFRPEQIKSAIGNRGTFDPASGDIRASRTADGMQWLRDQQLPLGYKVNDFLSSSGKVGWWHRTIGTMHNLAERSPPFKRVYDAAQRFLNDVSLHAREAADLAPDLLPKLESLRDLWKSPLSAEDTRAIAGPIFEGTLRWTRDATGEVVKADDVGTAGVVWTDDELRARFKATDKQVELYRQFRASVDRSLQDLAVSDMLRFGGSDVEAVRAAALAAGDVTQAAQLMSEHLAELASKGGKDRAATLADTGAKILEKAQRARDLMARGYAPLSRFGHYTLDVTENGERVYFGLFESEADANRMARQMRKQHPGAKVAQGTMSDEAYRMFSGVSPETLELFGEMLGLETQADDAASQAFQQYLKLAKSNRSAMKRLIERKGIEGFSEDAGRVLAGFVYSNARQTAKNLHMGEMGRAVQAIAEEKGQGELLDAAVRLHQYITNPQEEGQAIKGLMFTQFLGGSIAAGLVNMTQPFMVTFPYLSQYGGVASAAARMSNAVRDAVRDKTGDAALDAALKRAEEEGVVSPQEVHSLIAQAKGAGALKAGDGTAAGDAAAKASNFMSKLMLAWGRPFALAEQFNRRVTFIAAYRTAVAEKMDDPAAFAERVIAETQFTYNKGNRPQWARGAVGGALFTFKQYSISYVELLSRMAASGPEGKRAALVGLAVLVLVAGLDGLPGAGDLEDIIDGLLQRLGYNFSTKQAKREFLAGIVGDGGAQFLTKGMSGLPGAPIDVAGRLGLGNLVPGTGLFLKKPDHGSDVAELLGPAGSLAKQAATGIGQLASGNVREAATSVLPVAAANVVKAYDMASMGMYRDTRGRKVLDTDGFDAFVKAIGFQPADVAKVQQAAGEVQRTIDLVKMRETEIADRWARGVFEKDAEAVREARAELAEWNRDNPSAKIAIDNEQIVKRVKAMSMSRQERVAGTAPKEIRAQVKRELEPTR